MLEMRMGRRGMSMVSYEFVFVYSPSQDQLQILQRFFPPMPYMLLKIILFPPRAGTRKLIPASLQTQQNRKNNAASPPRSPAKPQSRIQRL